MNPRFARALGVILMAAVAAWWGRVVAHSKMPPPEGRWREIPPEDLE